MFENEAAEFPPGIGKVARRELALHGYTRYEHLTKVTSAELLKIHGVGPKAVRILNEELTADGIASGKMSLMFRRWRRPSARSGGTLLTG